MAAYATARSIRSDVAQMIRPPRRIEVADGARALKVVTATGAGEPWDSTTTPYMVKPLNATASRRHEAVVFVGPARSGKTLGLIEGRLAYTITCDPADAMVVQSTKDSAEDYSKTRIRRAIKESPELARQLSPRAHDDNVLMKFFRSGMSLRMGWPSVSVLSGSVSLSVSLPSSGPPLPASMSPSGIAPSPSGFASGSNCSCGSSSPKSFSSDSGGSSSRRFRPK